MNPTRLSLLLFLATIIYILSAYGQVSPYVVDVKIPAASEKTPLSVSIELTQNTKAQKILLHYREFGASEFKELEMLLSGRTAVATLPAKVMTPPYIEYYISLRFANNTAATFPSEAPELNPIKIQIKGVDPKDLEVRFLSPEPGETLAAEDLAVAVSLMFASDAINKEKTKIYLDGADVSGEAIITDDVILYNPNNFNKSLALGSHSLKIELIDTVGKLYYSKQVDFNLSTATAIEEAQSAFQYAGNGQLEFRNEKVDVTTTTYVRGDVHVGGTYKEFLFGGDVHVTNEEKSYLQPQNRFLATFQAGDYAKLQVGDAYPAFPSLIVSGKRVRGISGSLTLGTFNLDVSYGKTYRAVEGTEKGLKIYDSLSQAQLDDQDKLFVRPDTGASVVYMLFDRGTFARNFFAVRPSFGDGENFQFGLTYMHSKDDEGSITYGRYPQENLALGTDMLVAFDNQRVRWLSQAAVSVENKDISPGDYTDEDFYEFKGVYDTSKSLEDRQKARDDADQLIKIAKVLRSFITVNSSISPLNPESGMPSLAYESELSLNYFNNFLRAMVFRRGLAYKSYGNDFIQSDIAGWNVSDRVRFLDNKMMASVSYESKKNNTQNEASTPTTTYNTLSTSVTAYPGVNLPSFTLGYGFYTRKNPIDLAVDNTYIDSVSIANEKTNRFYFATNYDFKMLAQNSATVSLSIANKKDNTFYLRHQDNINVSASVLSRYTLPLQTTLAIIISHTSAEAALRDTLTKQYLSATLKQTYNYQTLSLGARYRMMNDRLDILATLAPSFGDFKRLLVQAGAEYQFMENHFVTGQIDFIKNSGRANDVIASLLYRLLF